MDAIVIVLLFQAFALLPASLAILFFYAYPAFTGILALAITREAIGGPKIIALLLSALGLILLLQSSLADLNPLGIILALGAAIAKALYLIYSPRVLREVPQLTLASWLFIGSTVVYGVIGAALGQLQFDLTLTGWGYIGVLSIFSTVVATIAMVNGLKLIVPTLAAIIHTLEPLVTAILAYLVFGELLNNVQIMGAGLILLAIIFPHLAKRPKSLDKQTA